MRIKYINLGGIGIAADSDINYKKNKIIAVKLTANLPDKTVETTVNVMLIDEIERRTYRGIYRKLTHEQIAALKEISEYFADKPTELSEKLDVVSIQ